MAYRKQHIEFSRVPPVVEILWGDIDSEGNRAAITCGRPQEGGLLLGPRGRFILNGNWKDLVNRSTRAMIESGRWIVIMYFEERNQLTRRTFTEAVALTAKRRESDGAVIPGDVGIIEDAK